MKPWGFYGQDTLREGDSVLVYPYRQPHESHTHNPPTCSWVGVGDRHPPHETGIGRWGMAPTPLQGVLGECRGLATRSPARIARLTTG